MNKYTGFACLSLLARYHGVPFDQDRLDHEMILEQSITPLELVIAARHLELHARIKKPSLDRLAMLSLPAIAQEENGEYFLLGAIAEKDGEIKYLVQRPYSKLPLELNRTEFSEMWNGTAIVFTSKKSMMGDLAKFDFSWFIPAVIKYRKQLGEVLLVSLALQLFALATPLFFQVVMTKCCCIMQ